MIIYKVLYTWCLKYNIYSAWFLDIRISTYYNSIFKDYLSIKFWGQSLPPIATHLHWNKSASGLRMKILQWQIILYLSEEKLRCLFPISNFYPGVYTSPFAFYIGVYLLQSIEPLCLFEPRRLYEHCFYSDKYSTLKITMYIYGISSWWYTIEHITTFVIIQ